MLMREERSLLFNNDGRLVARRKLHRSVLINLTAESRQSDKNVLLKSCLLRRRRKTAALESIRLEPNVTETQREKERRWHSNYQMD